MTKSLNQNWLDVNIQPRARVREGANEPISTEKEIAKCHTRPFTGNLEKIIQK